MSAKIVVAVAHTTARDLIQTVLIRRGLAVHAFTNGSDAMAAVQAERPDVLICDADLPQVSGVELAGGFRETIPELKVLLLFDHEIPALEREERTRDCGAAAGYARPSNSAVVLHQLASWGLTGETPVFSSGLSFSVPRVGMDPVAESRPAPAGAGPRGLDADALPEFEVAALEAEPEPDPKAEPEPEPEHEHEHEPAPEDATAMPARRAEAGRAEIPEGVEAAGDLRDHPLPRLMFELYAWTFTGKLVLQRSENATAEIRFGAGRPVSVWAQGVEDTLGAMLTEHGDITPQQYDQAQQLTLDKDIRFGEALIEIGALTTGGLHQALHQQLERKLARCFGWRVGTYALTPATGDEGALPPFEVDPMTAIWRGIGEHYSMGELFDFFQKLGPRYAVGTPLFEVHWPVLAPLLGELALLELFDGKTTLEAILRSDDANAQRVAQALYLLMVTDMVCAQDEPGEAVESSYEVTEEVHATSYRELAARFADQERSTEEPSVARGGQSTRARRRSEISAERMFSEGQQLLRDGEVEESRKRFTDAINLSPSEATYYAGMARTYLGDPPDPINAMRYLEEALRHNPASVSANLAMAELCISTQQIDMAKPHLERILTRIPDHPGATELMKAVS